jgi:hypothetical protein
MADEPIILHIESMSGESVRALVAYWDWPGADSAAKTIAMRTVALDGAAKIDELRAEVASLTTERDRLRGQLSDRELGAEVLRSRIRTAVAERDATQALLVEEQRDHAATRAEAARGKRVIDNVETWRWVNEPGDAHRALYSIIAAVDALSTPTPSESPSSSAQSVTQERVADHAADLTGVDPAASAVRAEP